MKLTLLCRILAVMGLGCAVSYLASATTTDEMRIVSGATTITVFDTGSGSPGEISYSNSNINGWDLFIEVGVSDSPSTDPGLDVTSLTASCGGFFTTTCAANPLSILYGDINFTQADSTFSTTYSSTQTGGGTTSMSAYLDNSNTIFGEGTLIGNTGPFSAPGGASTVTKSLSAGPSPYALTLAQVFTDDGSGSDVYFSADGNVGGSVPEPGAVVLFGTVLVFLASKLRRSRAS